MFGLIHVRRALEIEAKVGHYTYPHSPNQIKKIYNLQ